MKKKVIIVCGPTGTGKTETAIVLAREFNGELINADSQQVYKYIPILTNQLDSSEVHLTQFLEPWEKFNVFEWRELAIIRIEEIISNGKVPVVVGGTGLYIDALVNDYKLQKSNDEVNWEERKTLESYTVKKLWSLVDQDTLDSLNNSDKNNKRRLIRLVEKSQTKKENGLVGMPAKAEISDEYGFGNEEAHHQEDDKDYLMLYPEFNWEELKVKLEKRVLKMISMGAVKEVLDLVGICRHGKPDVDVSIERFPALGTMGVKQVYQFITSDKKKFDVEVELIQIAHRQYAKRQRTWFEGKGRGYDLNKFSDAKDAINKVSKFLVDSI